EPLPPMRCTMITQFEYLKNKSVREARSVEDYVQIEFEDGSILNIFNANSLYPPGASLLNAKLASVTDEGSTIKFMFDDRLTLIVSMQESDFTGPEAMELIRADGQRIIWS